MSEIHFERPDKGDTLSADHSEIIAYSKWSRKWMNVERYKVAQGWNNPFTAWMEMPPAPVKPKRFVVEENMDGTAYVWDNANKHSPAHHIPTREAAQRIADIYEETTP